MAPWLTWFRNLGLALIVSLALLGGCFVDTSGAPVPVPDAGCEGCDDGFDCTDDSCDALTALCVHDAYDSRCPGRLVCDIEAGCVDPGCNADNCQVSNECESAECVGDDCVRTPSCGLEEFCCAGTCAPLGCDDALGCTADRCGSDGCIHEVVDGCLIDGACVAGGAASEMNSCLTCVPSGALDRWSIDVGADCNDGEYCTVEDRCDPAGACHGAMRSCDDTLACTRDACDEAADRCVNALTAGCLIEGICIIEGAGHPSNECLHCEAASNVSAWAARTGEPCDDGRYCTLGETCNRSGRCRGGRDRDCGDGIACTSDTCAEAAGRCESSVSIGCLIDATCLPRGVENPANQCERCLPGRSRTSWSVDTGGSCDDGLFCQVGETCRADGTCIAAESRGCTDAFDCTADSCDEARDRCRNTLSGCLIGGVCYSNGDRNAGNPCRRCTPGTSPVTWTTAIGASCDDSLFCNSGETCQADASCGGGAATDCSDGFTCTTDSCREATDSCLSVPDGAAGCFIASACIAPGTPHPSDPCFGCNPGADPSAWTPNTGAACDDATRCTVGDTCQSDGVCSGMALDCSRLDEACMTGVCSEGTGECGARIHIDGTICEDGLACTAGDRCTVGVCEGAPVDCSLLDTECVRGECDPTDGTCVPNTVPDLTPCNDGNLCTSEDQCASGVCDGTFRECGGACGGACPSTCRPEVDGMMCVCACPP